MASRAKIFISSVAQDEFTALRRDVFGKLKELGHEPLMFEENFGPWPSHADPVRKCLEIVEESDIFLLFIKNKAGTYLKASERTVTHLEFLHAKRHKKTILVFADSGILAHYFKEGQKAIGDYAAMFESDRKRPPRYAELVDLLRGSRTLPDHIDPYIWLFLHDLVQKGVYVEGLTTGVGVDWAAYFSSLLRRGALLLPEAEAMEHNARMVERYADYHGLLSSLVPVIEWSGFRDADKFLSYLQGRAKGGAIAARYADYTSEELGSMKDCSAVTLYLKKNGAMHIVGRTAAATGKDVIDLADPDSYVAQTHHNPGREPMLFFREDKHMLYFCLAVQDYVVTFHFPADRMWDAQKFWLYNQEAIHAIMEKNFMLMELVQLLLGGMSRG
ncbi:DUF4062 domain-containing protein [Paenibacillus sp. MBLB4367]|uniref:DUF4062 domain-containing protein n=1 Tax=Paenibacillus sp. MBLB4367 TaxID=3384767 RepID=UPI0039083946